MKKRSPLNSCPDEEGIKTVQSKSYRLRSCPLNSCPDEEGIKTQLPRQTWPQTSLNSCPDEEGIKTSNFFALSPVVRL